MVTKKPTAVGNSLAVVLNKPVLEAAGIKDTALEVSVSGDVREQGRADRIEAIANDIFARHTAAFKRLAE